MNTMVNTEARKALVRSNLPVSVLVVNIVGKPNIFPSVACAKMLFFICTADMSREIW